MTGDRNDSEQTADLTSEEATRLVKETAIRAGGTVVGIAPVPDWAEFVPEGYRPDDILPNAQSVVVVGARGPTAGAWKCPDSRLIEVNGYDFANDRAIHVVANFIEQEFGHYAMQAPSLPTAGHQPPMSMMLAAVLAGLGTWPYNTQKRWVCTLLPSTSMMTN